MGTVADIGASTLATLAKRQVDPRQAIQEVVRFRWKLRRAYAYVWRHQRREGNISPFLCVRR